MRPSKKGARVFQGDAAPTIDVILQSLEGDDSGAENPRDRKLLSQLDKCLANGAQVPNVDSFMPLAWAAWKKPGLAKKVDGGDPSALREFRRGFASHLREHPLTRPRDLRRLRQAAQAVHQQDPSSCSIVPSWPSCAR